jgi:hypothetical protein
MSDHALAEAFPAVRKDDSYLAQQPFIFSVRLSLSAFALGDNFF